MCADIAIATNLGLGQDNAKLPDPGPRSDAGSLCLRRSVDLFIPCLLRGDRDELITRAQIEYLSPPEYAAASIRDQTLAHQEMSANRKT
jgi:hypothetical protein